MILPFYVMAGGSPETTLVVVNAHSPLSMRIANEYVHMRNIPENHIVLLDNITSTEVISIEDFRKKIWSPVQEFIHSHKLGEEIDVITYSADFPYAVNFKSDIRAKKLKKNNYRGHIASLTALTYFAHRVETGDIGYLGKNYYFRDFARPEIKTTTVKPTAFPLPDKKAIQQLKHKARKSLSHKDLETAIRIYQKIADSYPEYPMNWYNLARSQAKAGSREKAIESLTSAVDYGWTNSLRTDKDIYFNSLRSDPDFKKLLKRMETAYGPFLLTNGFRNHYVWSNSDLTVWEPADSLNQYYLSTMLAYTGERGNSFTEIMNYLSASASSDATHPEGTVYLLENKNVRSRTRQPLFPITLKELAQRKQKAEILNRENADQNGILPIAKTDVIGAVIGFNDFKWGETNSRLLPGAIAESLTSYGGHFNKAKQTKLTEFLRYGAAGSSGAVTEPYAFQEKFPVPLIHAWYADGCSLAEAFYQSIITPYQLIIVGDPLARPFAAFADIKLKSPPLQSPWSGNVIIEADIKPAPGKAVNKMEFWVDGQYLFDVPSDESFSWNTRTVEDGSHDIRLIAIEDSNIETRSSTEFIAQVFNNHHQVNVKPISGATTYEDTIKIKGSAPGAEKVEIIRGYHKLGTTIVKNAQWQMTIPATTFGIGPISFFARATYPDGKTVRSAPVEHLITLPDNTLNPVMNERPSNSGLSAIVHDQKGNKHALVIKQLNGIYKELRKKKLKAKKLKLNGFFHIASPGFYQFSMLADGHLRLFVNDQLLLDKQLSKNKGNIFMPINLKQGWYKLAINLEVSNKPFLKVVLAGDQVPSILSGDILGHNQTLPDN